MAQPEWAEQPEKDAQQQLAAWEAERQDLLEKAKSQLAAWVKEKLEEVEDLAQYLSAECDEMPETVNDIWCDALLLANEVCKYTPKSDTLKDDDYAGLLAMLKEYMPISTVKCLECRDTMDSVLYFGSYVHLVCDGCHARSSEYGADDVAFVTLGGVNPEALKRLILKNRQ